MRRYVLGEKMSFVNKEVIRGITGVSDEKQASIKAFLQGAVYCWCKNRKDEWFSLRDLMGGDNFYWQGTPLISLYEKHEAKGSDDPVKDAGKDAGWLLKSVIGSDRRQFDTKKEDLIRKYRWTGE
ncbi:TPA: hypothetical protein GRI74_24300 [Vibrio parahaemolyticus]|nr:hypothetical protein [Vibrio parahaemolyticus]EGQ9755816.1 hypothetical protein [Vibrio parahaemolyticus]EGR0633036.1 hypothetical protein [Vibrio parahaemolyticus]EGR0703704.1 hypothetical protein [Vibrio parahaemolyticus]EGR0888939.1 hypothetical protein [Vibrio parahaemolyticus]